MILNDAVEDMRRLSRLIDQGLAALREQSAKLAEAERAYRRAKSEAFAVARDGTVPEKTAWVNARTADLRFERDMADLLRQSALEAVRSRRTQVSAWQSLLAAEREEAGFTRVGPEAA